MGRMTWDLATLQYTAGLAEPAGRLTRTMPSTTERPARDTCLHATEDVVDLLCGP
jgi:hypothetical protein